MEQSPVQWYIASFVAHRQQGHDTAEGLQSCEYWCLLTAVDANGAYDKALAIASNAVAEMIQQGESEWLLDGIGELLMVIEPPSDGSELIWAQQEIGLKELLKYTKARNELSAFTLPPRSQPGTGWYICKLVLVEVHDTGTHGDSLLVWTDSHLIRAADPDSAYMSAVDLGRAQASESGTHRCNGDTAHWEFNGLRNLIEAQNPPGDTTTLWMEEFVASSDELRTLVPARPELGVFAWQARQQIKA